MMMTVNCDQLTEKLQKGIQLLAAYGLLEQSKAGVAVMATPAPSTIVEKTEGEIRISYDTLPHFYMALCRALCLQPGTYPITPEVQQLGLMLDCSRNAMMLPQRIQGLICLMALAGYTYLELYMEDTYALPDEPYFGYKRGRYTVEEIKSIIAFAAVFGIAIVPCMQTLSHLPHLASWEPYKTKMQNPCTLRTDDETVYELIRKCLRHCKSVFGTDRIHIGMDEAPIDKEQYRKHFIRVFEICREEGIQPDFWADAFYLEGQTDEIPETLFDGTQTPVYWEYYETDPQVYRRTLSRLQKAAGKVSFAGCLHKHMGIAPDNGLANKTMDIAFPVVKEFAVTDILMTTWGDHGNECPFYAIMPSFWYAAQKLYPCPVDLDDMVCGFTGYTCAQWQIADEINYIVRMDKKICNASIWGLYNDLLIGMMDCHISDDADAHYRKLHSLLMPLQEKDSQFSYIFRLYAALCDVMSRKTTFSKRLRRAYLAEDRQTMEAMKRELPELRKKIETFRCVFRDAWMRDNKGFGFEVMDIRFGGMAARCQTTAAVLEDYLDGKIQHIYELEEERLPYWADGLEPEHTYAPWFFHWSKSFTENDIL